MPEHQQTQKSTEPKPAYQKQATHARPSPISSPMAIIQRAKINPRSLTPADVMQLQSTIGNRAVVRLLSEIGLIPSKAKQAPPVQRQELVQCQEIPEEEESLQGKMAETVQPQEIPEEEEPLQGKMAKTIQRQEIPEEEEPLQGKFIETVQRQEIPEEEEPLQGKFENKPEKATCPSCVADSIMQMQEIPEEEEPLQGKFETIQRLEPEDEEKLQMKSIVQRQEIPEEEEPLQGKMIGTVQRQETLEEEEPLQTKRENNTGMPDNLKAGVESLSGIDMSDVRVHYNSSKPAEVGALAYTQGANIHVASGQERHLPHEAWHVVQQKQGRVRPTMQLKGGIPVNDDSRLEREADELGKRVAREPLARVKGSINKERSDARSNSVKMIKCSTCKHVEKEREWLEYNPLISIPRQSWPKCEKRLIQRNRFIHHPGCGVIQMRPCSDGVEWSTRTPGNNANVLRASGMQVTPEEAHILCCAYCKAQVHSLTSAGGADPRLIQTIRRFTNLFDHYIPQEQAGAQLPPTTTLNLEESYFIGVNHANDGLLNNVWWNTIRANLNAPVGGFFTGVGVYPVGLPVHKQAQFDQLQAFGLIPAAPPLPAGRRSYRLLRVVNHSNIYRIVRFLKMTPAVGVGVTHWGTLRMAAGGHARSSDVTIDRAPPGGAPSSSILDAKFSYGGGGYDYFHANQEADLLRAHQRLPGGGGGVHGVPPAHIAPLTIATCSCNRDLIEIQKRSRTRSQTNSGPDEIASRTRGAGKRIREQLEDQENKRKRLKCIQ